MKNATNPILISLCMAACAASLSVFADGDSVTAWAGSAIAVDFRDGERRAVSPGAIGYSPKWCGVTNEGAYVVLEKVERAGMHDATTNVLATFSADAEGECPYAVGDGDERCVRFIHRVYSSGGVEIGEPLVRDVSFGYKSAAGVACVADSRTNSLQLAVKGKEPVNLAYSTAWATNAAAVSISAVQLSNKGGAPTATNAMYSAVAAAEGATPMRGVGKGWWRLLCQVTGASGDTLLEYLTDEFGVSGGLVVEFR